MDITLTNAPKDVRRIEVRLVRGDALTPAQWAKWCHIRRRLEVIADTLKVIATPGVPPTTLRRTSMADTYDDVDKLLDDLKTYTDDLAVDAGKIVTNEAAQLAEITELKRQLAAGTAVTSAQLDSLATKSRGVLAGLGGLKATLAAVAVSPSDPLPTPVEPPVDPGNTV